MTPTMFAIALFAGLVSALITGVVLRVSLRRQLVDVPNARSSHTVPTPSMGGIGLAVVVIGGIVAAGFTGALSMSDSVILAATSGAIAITGFIDDRRGLPARWRLLVQVACAGVLLAGIDRPLATNSSPIAWGSRRRDASTSRGRDMGGAPARGGRGRGRPPTVAVAEP